MPFLLYLFDIHIKKLQKYDLFLKFHYTFKFASLLLLGLWI